MRHITVIALPRALGTSITLPMEMLNAAASMQRVVNHRHTDTKAPDLTIEIAGVSDDPFSITGGIEIHPHRTLASIDSTDLVIIPALWGNPKPMLRRYPQIIPWLQQQAQQGAILCGIGTGVCFLAEAGLLDGKPATTHWYYFEQFQKAYPKVNLQTKRFITNADNIYCAGRINSITNLMIHFIEQFFNQDIARHIEQHFAHEIKPSYESIFYSFDEQSVHHDEEIIQAQQWLLRNYANTIQMSEVASQFGMSQRTFNRRFKLATGSTPLDYLQHIRIGGAQELLKETNLSIAEVSHRVGFTDPSYFSVLFKRQLKLSPKKYRELARAKLFSVEND